MILSKALLTLYSKPTLMKKALPLIIAFSLIIISVALGLLSCSHKYYKTSWFDQQTANHKVVAVLPAEMIFTGKQPENLSVEEIAKIEEQESKNFQQSLYNSILRYANSRKYFTRVNLQDLSTTRRILEEHNINYKDAWKKDDKELAALLGVDAVVKMRIQKQIRQQALRCR